MIYTNLDQIVRRTLLERGMPLHFYLEFLLHAATCVRQLSKDTLQLVNTVKLPVNSYSAIDLPDDFVDELSVGFNVAGYIKEIPKNSHINPLRNIDSEGDFVPYSSALINNSALAYYGVAAGWGFFWNLNEYGEPTGRYFGISGGSRMGYKVVRERRQIQLTGNITSGYIVLMYISDGMRADNATQVDVRAWDTVNAYINWQRGPNAAIKDAPEARTFYNEKRLLRANMNDITITDIKNIVRSNYMASIKT